MYTVIIWNNKVSTIYASDDLESFDIELVTELNKLINHNQSQNELV